MKLVKAAILIEERGSASELRLEGSSLPCENPALVASDSTNRDQGSRELSSAPLDTQGSSCPPLGKASQGEEVSPDAVELEGATGPSGQANPNLEQIDIIAELAEGKTLGSDKCFKNVPANQISGEQAMDIQPSHNEHVAK